MTKENQFQDIKDIKQMMERSSRFLSLSGLSGISAGIIALIGVAIAHYFMISNNIKYDVNLRLLYPVYEIHLIEKLAALAIIILFLALSSGLFFSWRKAKRNGYKLWDHTTKRLLFHLFIPLIAGGFFILTLIYHNNVALVASATLIFYGLALVNASKYTIGEVQYLGICEIVLGIFAGVFLNYGIFFWAFGFGVLHILYGTIMYFKYERK